MRFAVSTIALPAFDHGDEMDRLAALGIEAVEVAPSRAWFDTWPGPGADAVARYRKRIESAGLGVVGLHSLFFDQPRLGLFKDAETRAESLDFLEHLSKVCRDLGGRTLIYGVGRNRGALAADDARAEAGEFFGELCRRVENHGTCFCFEPLGPKDSDFINSALESMAIAEMICHDAVRVQLDAKALVENGEAVIETFRAVAPMLVHFHANEPGLGMLGQSGAVDHAAMGQMLNAIGYDGYVSIEQRMIDEADPMAGIGQSAHLLKECYS